MIPYDIKDTDIDVLSILCTTSMHPPPEKRINKKDIICMNMHAYIKFLKSPISYIFHKYPA